MIMVLGCRPLTNYAICTIIRLSIAFDFKGQVIILNLKRLCHTLVFMAAAAVLCSLFSITAFATSYAEFYIPDGAVAQGSEFEVTVKFTSDQNIGTVQSDFVYDDSSVQFVPDGDMVTGGSGILLINASPDKDSTELSVTLTFTALKKEHPKCLSRTVPFFPATECR